jgi:glycosyl transferase family 25
MIAELKKTRLDYEIVTAVDGNDVDLNDKDIIDPSFTYRTPFLPGTAGAALSHLSVYKKIVADELDVALVLEDDVMLSADLGSLADAVADHLEGAEVALLSYGSYRFCALSPEGSVPLPSARLLALPIEIRMVNSGGAYIITRESCERMIKSVLPVRVNPDDWWYFYREGALDRVRCVMPIPVLKSPKLISTLGSYQLGNGLKGRLAWRLMHFKIPIVHQMLIRRRRRIHELWSQQLLVDVPFIEKPSRLE